MIMRQMHTTIIWVFEKVQVIISRSRHKQMVPARMGSPDLLYFSKVVSIDLNRRIFQKGASPIELPKRHF